MKIKHRFIVSIIFIAVTLATLFVIYKRQLAPLMNLPQRMEKIRTTLDNASRPEIEIIAENLNIPWEIEFLPNQEILVTERSGQLIKLGADRKIINIEGVYHIGEGGLLGMALHPRFSANHRIYLYLTSKINGEIINRVERYRLEEDKLADRQVMIDKIPGAEFHDGGRIAFGPDGYLYITTGDAQRQALSQDTQSLAGKILRIRDDGSIPLDNPFKNAVYSYGHRNSQGLAWDKYGRLWATEHGRSGLLSGYDELNLIEKGKNYGWPLIQGDEAKAGLTTPVINSGPSETWAPAAALYLDDRIFFTGLRGATLYEAKISDTGRVEYLKKHLQDKFGRLRAFRLGPDGYIYLTTSNRDGRGTPAPDDDKLIRLDPKALQGW